MGALAALLQDQGWFVTGSDGPLYPPMSTFLAERKIPLRTGFEPKNIDGATWDRPGAKPDLVVIGNAISRSNAEAQAVEAAGLRKMSFPEALAEFSIRDRRSFVVAGTHGKTTTTSLMAWGFEALGRDPGFLIGGIPLNFQKGCRNGEGPVFVTEGDEYDTAYWDKGSKFLHYRPSWVLCTGIEFDHADIYSSVEMIEDSFLKLTAITREGWLLIDDASSPRASSVARVAKACADRGLTCLRYGQAPGSHYRLLKAEPCEVTKGAALGTRIRMTSPELGEVEFVSPMTGLHNALNAVGVAGTLLASGEARTADDVQKAFAGFKGVRRRQEEIHSSNALVVIDDFAHHPTAIRETIRAIRSRYPGRRIAAFFEPRSATSGRNVLAAEFAACFDDADAVFLVTPTKTNIPEAEKLNVPRLLEEVGSRPANAGKTLRWTATVPELVKPFDDWRRTDKSRGALALVMSNGPFGGLHGMLAETDV